MNPITITHDQSVYNLDDDLNFQEKKVSGRGQHYCFLAVIQGSNNWNQDSAN
jgi:hypothetical protein